MMPRIFFCFWFLLTAALPTLAEETQLENLQVGTQTYHNVIITSRNPKKFVIMHSTGMATIKVEDLDPATRVKLGYDEGNEPHSLLKGTAMANLPIDPQLVQVSENFSRQLTERIKGADKKLSYAVGTVFFAFYLFFCYCCKLICEKAGYKPGAAVWLPVFQWYSLMKAAGMSGWWFLVFLSPAFTPLVAGSVLQSVGPDLAWVLLVPSGLSCLGMVIWCFMICRARDVSVLLGVCLLLPLLNLLAFLYLAFGPAAVKPIERPSRSGTKSWTKSHAQDTSFFLQT
jgi:hypothetical protein